MRIVVMGSGGTGGYFGAKLARAGEDVTFVARGAHLEAIRARPEPFDLLLFGNEAADTGDYQVGVRVAVALGRPVDELPALAS